MLQQCNHPNVVRYLGSFQGDDYLWVSSICAIQLVAFVVYVLVLRIQSLSSH